MGIDTGKVKISAILVVYNESANIRRCLDSLKWTDDIVVIDQSSTDGTAGVCREYTDRVFVVPSKGYCEPDRKVAVEKASNEWMLYVDADEVISEELRDEITELLSSNPQFGNYYVLRKNYLLGRWIKGSGWNPNYVLRLFKKGQVRFSDIIHADTEPLGPSGYLKGAMLHYSYETLHDYITKIDRYTTVLAAQAYVKGKRVRPITFIYDFLLLPATYFFQKFFLKRGCIDGFRGFLIAAFTFSAVFLTNAKIWELQINARGDK